MSNKSYLNCIKHFEIIPLFDLKSIWFKKLTLIISICKVFSITNAFQFKNNFIKLLLSNYCSIRFWYDSLSCSNVNSFLRAKFTINFCKEEQIILVINNPWKIFTLFLILSIYKKIIIELAANFYRKFLEFKFFYKLISRFCFFN